MGSLEWQRDDTEPPRWLLASISPRRRELLREGGQDFEIEPSGLEEARRADETPAEFARRMALEKAREVAGRRPGRWVLAADTVVVCGADVLGKPVDAGEARRMLRRLSGRDHQVITGYALIDPRGEVFSEGTVSTTVVFREIAAAEIERYVASGEPLDKAGAYAVQGAAGEFVREVHGSLTNVIGLPMDEVSEALRAAGLWVEARRR